MLGSATPGIGLYLSFLGTGLIVLGAVLWFVGRPREGIAPQPSRLSLDAVKRGSSARHRSSRARGARPLDHAQDVRRLAR
jgi:hypothetical protein